MSASNAPNFNPARESLQWARSDIADLTSGFQQFFSKRNVSVVVEHDEETGLNLTKVRIADDVPMGSFKRHAVNGLLNIRNSFDQVVNIAGSHLTKKRFKKNYPWSTTPNDLETYRLKDFPEELRNAIRAQKPYPSGDGFTGGNDLIRALAKLSNNKHSIGFALDLIGGIDPSGDIEFVGMGTLGAWAFFPPNWDPIRREVVLFGIESDGVAMKLKEHAKLTFRVCLEVPDLHHPPEVLFALNEFLTASEKNLRLVEAACTE